MTCMDEIQKLEAIRFDGYVGILSVAVLGVNGSDNIDSFIVTAGAVKSEPIAVGGDVSLKVMRDDTELKIEGSAASMSPSAGELDSGNGEEATVVHKYRAVLDTRIIPVDTYMQTELDAICESDLESKVSFRVKLSFASINTQLESKNAELEQIYTEMNAVKEAIRTRSAASNKAKASTSSAKPSTKNGKKSTGKKGSTKKSAAKASEDDDVAEAGDEEGAAEGGSAVDSILGALFAAKDVTVQHYSFGLFALASAAIYFYGDYASV